MKTKALLLSLLLLISCTDSNKKLNYLKTQFPKCKVEPATGLIQQNGFEFIIIDSTNQIIAVSFYAFSETKIQTMRNVR